MSEFFLQFVQLMQTEMVEPLPFGSWHIISLICTVLLTAVMLLFLRNISDRGMRLILFFGWLILVFFELIRQAVFSFTFTDGVASWSYNWSFFPFQFCSSPLYAFPFIFLLRDCALRRAMIVFLSTFSLLAGLIVVFYPNTVFTVYTGINIQTMVHHGLQVVLGIYLFAYARRQLRWRDFLGAVLIFIAFFATAVWLNDFVYDYLISAGKDFSFNMFFISPHYYMDTEIPAVVFLREYFSHRAFLILYAVAFPIGSLIIYSIEKGILWCFRKRPRS